MAAWNIHPEGVAAVLLKVGAKADAMKKDLAEQNFTELGHALSAGGTGLLGEVPSAVHGLIEDQSANFTTIGNHVKAGVLGVTDATIAYNNAQSAMVTDTNRYNRADAYEQSMLLAAQYGNMRYFMEHGYDEHGKEIYRPLPSSLPRHGQIPIAE